jgi:type IV pilus assembly protein PilM
MVKKVLSIVIGTDCTKVCELSYRNYSNKGIRVYNSISFPTPPNTIEDGYIRDMQGFGEELKNRLKANRIKTTKVVFSITSSKIATREVILPPVKEKKIMEIITTGATEYFPIELKDYILSYQILEKINPDRKVKFHGKKEDKKARKLEKQEKKALKKKSKTEIIADNMELMEARQEEPALEAEDNKKRKEKAADSAWKSMRISVFAAPSTLIKNYYSFAKQMHLDIVAIDHSGNSSYQAIKRQGKRGTNVFVQINQKDSLISILRDDVLILQRMVGYGLTAIVETVMEQDCFGVKTPEQAIEFINRFQLLSSEPGQAGPGPAFDHMKEEAAAARDDGNDMYGMDRQTHEKIEYVRSNIRESLHFLASSIARMLDYYKSSHKQIDIDTIYLTGSGVHIRGIEEFFTREIGIPHKNMEKLYTFSAKKQAATYRHNPGEFITCLGALIKPVDFVPMEFTLKKQKRSEIIGTIVFSLACLAGALGTVYVGLTDYQAAKEELDQVTEEYNALPALSGAHEKYEIALTELDNLEELEKKTKSNNDYITDVITELENKLPKGTVIHSMQFTENNVTMSVTATAENVGPNALVAVIFKQLKGIGYFGDNIEISGITVREEDGISLVSFTILCTYAQ